MSSPPKKPAKFHTYPFWSPRFWHGLRFGDWLKLAAAHQFRFHPIRWPMAFLITLITPFNTIMGWGQRLKYGKRIDATPIEQPPVFIIGHWRSGTTFLHELLDLDERFTTPTTYQCFAPRHFLMTEWLVAHYLGFLMPKQRPMDNMAMGWNHPQEDEFALLSLGVPTPYLRMAFPNDPPPYMEFLDMEGVAPQDLQKFEAALVEFVRLLTFRTRKQVLLKSPPHTGRIATLARLFPGAKFIHIVRSPYALFPSTVRLWKSLDEVQGLQMPRGKGLEEYVFECLSRMYAGFEKQRQEIDPAHICDLKYEDFVQRPLEEMERVYRHLGLGDFQEARPRIAAYLDQQKNYQTNKHELDDATQARIRQRWGAYIERYGY